MSCATVIIACGPSGEFDSAASCSECPDKQSFDASVYRRIVKLIYSPPQPFRVKLPTESRSLKPATQPTVYHRTAK
jgi:hypothetical protein